jgi:hypothetical protein
MQPKTAATFAAPIALTDSASQLFLYKHCAFCFKGLVTFFYPHLVARWPRPAAAATPRTGQGGRVCARFFLASPARMETSRALHRLSAVGRVQLYVKLCIFTTVLTTYTAPVRSARHGTHTLHTAHPLPLGAKNIPRAHLSKLDLMV